MKPRNFPSRKLRRQLRAKYGITWVYMPGVKEQMEQARAVRTKKHRA